MKLGMLNTARQPLGRLLAWAATRVAGLDDRINPIAVKELRQAVQAKYVSGLLLLCLAAQFLATAVVSLGRRLDVTSHEGPGTFLILHGILVTTCMVLLPMFIFGRSMAERARTDLDLFSMTTLRPRAVVWGRLSSGMMLVVLVYSACAPFLIFTYFLKGIDLSSILVTLVAGLVVSVIVTQLAVFFTCVRVPKQVRALAGLVLLGAGGMGVFFATVFSSLVVVRGFIHLGAAQAWAALGVIAGVALAVVSLLFALSVAVISPRSANRALPVRVCTTGVWALGFAGVAVWSLAADWLSPVYIWMIASVGLFCLGLPIAVSERDSYGPRIVRTIPRTGWRRVPAFLFSSGAAGGIAWCCTMIGLTLAIAAAWSASSWMRDSYLASYLLSLAVRMAVASLYVYSYCMTAVLFRRKFLRGPDTVYTSAFVLVVAAVASIGFIWSHDPHLSSDAAALWNLTNPMILLDGWEPYLTVAASLALLWAMMVTGLNGSWLVKQFRAFRRGDAVTNTGRPRTQHE